LKNKSVFFFLFLHRDTRSLDQSFALILILPGSSDQYAADNVASGAIRRSVATVIGP